MKKIIAAIAGIIALAIIGATAFSIGVRDGIRRAIEESKIYLNGSIVEIRLNGEVYEHIAE